MKHDLAGKKIGRWNVLSVSHKKGPHYYWKCRCDCGTEKIVQGQSLGVRSFSCGCLRKQIAKQVNTTHSMSRTNFYWVWVRMIQRCENKNATNYKFYGGRGISVCNRWKNFENFKEDMFSTYKLGLSIDRINNDADYKPSNCKWSTPREQARNRRSTNIYKTPWGELSLSEAAEKAGVTVHVLLSRMSRGIKGKALWNSPTSSATAEL